MRKDSIMGLTKSVKEFTNDPTVYPEDQDWLYTEMQYTDIYLDSVKLRWQELGEDFFLWFVELFWKKSFLHSLINRQLFPGKNESIEEEVKEFLVGAYNPQPYRNEESEEFRGILKDTLTKIWGIVKSVIFRVNQIHFINGPMATCQSLNPACDQSLFNLTFSHEILARGRVEKSICHEVAHVLLEPIEYKIAEELALGVTKYLLVYVNEERIFERK